MKRTVRVIATLLALILVCVSLPIFSISSATLSSPFDATILKNSANSIKSVTINSSESIGNNGEVSLYKATITSSGTRKDELKSLIGATSRTFTDTFSGVRIATGGRLFVYSKSSSDGQSFSNNLIKDIAAQFEADHPEWKVAVVTNASFFDNEDKKTTDKGEPEDIYVEDGKTYKSYIEKGEDGGDVFKIGRGIVGLKSDGTMIYHTIEKGTSHYTGSTAYSFDEKYTLEVLGKNKNNSIYNYTLLPNGSFDFTSEPIFITPSMAAKDLRGATVYSVKCSQYRRAHVGVNGREVGDKTYYFEGNIESVLSGTSSMKPASGYVYIASYTPLEHLQVGVTVRGTRKMSGEWENVPYVFGYKQQILHEGTALFNGTHQESYGDTISGSYNATWSEDFSYAVYGSNRTAVGFKADGTPVIITMPRKLYYASDGTTVKAQTSATYSEMAWYMKSIGCVNAFMMDCGGSMGMYKKSTGSDTYEVACCEPLHTQPNRAVANALILAYPSGNEAKPTDERLADPDFEPESIDSAMNTPWYSGVTKLRSTSAVKNSSTDHFTSNATLSKTNFNLAQSGSLYTFTPTATAFPSGYEAVYAYKKLGYTVQEGKKYVYSFKLNTATKGKYTSFLFGEYPLNTASDKMLNNFAVVGGAFSNNGDTQYSDVRMGVGRVQVRTSDVLGSNQDINLYLETIGGKKYSYYRIDIDGLQCTLKTKNSSGTWEQIGGTYSLPSGTQLIMGCAAWEANTSRAMSVASPICVDITELSQNISKANALNVEEYLPDTWNKLDAARVKAGYSVKLINQTLLDYANAQLSSALNGLVKRVDVADANINEFKNTDKNGYTTQSWAVYRDAYQALADAREANDLSSLDALNEAYRAAYEALVPVEINVDITWEGMSFVYSPRGLTWNPDIHDYDGKDTIGWQENLNEIDILNSSNVDVSIELEFTPTSEFEYLDGSFYSNGALVEEDIIISQEENRCFNLKLKGEIPPTTQDNTKGGTVSVTVTRIA